MAVPETWESVYRQLPGELQPYLPSFEWQRDRLWTLALPIEEMAVADLAWQLELPWWRAQGRPFTLRPAEVLRDPSGSYQHHERALAADLSHPIHVTWRNSRWVILDGVHRLLRATIQGDWALAARKLPARSLPLIAANPIHPVPNDLSFVQKVVSMLGGAGVSVWVFGGWAEELLAIAAPRAHKDLDLLHRANSFARLDEAIAKLGLEEIREKRLDHKRAFRLDGVMVEILLVQPDRGDYFTNVCGRRHSWPAGLFAGSYPLPVASRSSVIGYRSAWSARTGQRS